ncbi:MAG TPA: hypothetical protein VHT51_08705, partial [Micropepsaceae bacterium]|nr:hypothetical protein [Micropepsaceae bacterium]
PPAAAPEPSHTGRIETAQKNPAPPVEAKSSPRHTLTPDELAAVARGVQALQGSAARVEFGRR